jgi:hypothetical protein
MIVVAGTVALAAPTRAAPLDHVGARTLVLVHGYTFLVRDCTGTDAAPGDFAGLTAELARWPGLYTNVEHWTYAPSNVNCTEDFSAGVTPSTPMRAIGSKFAERFAERFRNSPTPVDIVGHSNGGLVVRSAMATSPGSFFRADGSALVEDVVTGGTPHNGGSPCTIPVLCDSQQLRDATAGSEFLRELNCRPLTDDPAGPCGPFVPWFVDWTDMGSSVGGSGTDGVIPQLSALYPMGDHEVWLSEVSHTGYFGRPVRYEDYLAVSAAFGGLTDSAQ